MMRSMLRRAVRFRYSLRMLFVLVTVCCLWLGWNASVVRARRDMLRDVESRGGRAIEGFVLEGGQPLAWLDSTNMVPASGAMCEPVLPSSESPSSIRQLLGDATVGVIYLPSSEFSNEDAQRIQAKFPEALLLPGPFGMQANYQTSTVDD
jgi:hypothetical protein